MERAIIHRDFISVSPSAKWMLSWKGHTNIPFAREVAELLEYPNTYISDFKKRNFTFWASTFGLERRYWSVNQLLNDIQIRNILELSSGYSFRGLEYVLQKEVHYIDTDLSDIITTKRELIKCLNKEEIPQQGKLELLPLNALDRIAFNKTIDRFTTGEVIIVNEGLMGYLDKSEKVQLCSIIHDILTKRGGYWITADIGLKNKESKLGFEYTGEVKEFNKSQDTEGNSFETFKEAEIFFREMGFEIDKEAKVKVFAMSSFRYMIKSMSLRQIFKMRNNGGQIQTTWRLKAK